MAKQKEKYLNHWDAINAFIEEDALAAGRAQGAGRADQVGQKRRERFDSRVSSGDSALGG